MEPIKVYRNINATDQFFGLELYDGAVILLTFFLAFLFNKKGLVLNLLILGAVYLALRVLKRGKPAGYLLVLSRFILQSRFKRLPDFMEYEDSRKVINSASAPRRSKC